MSWDETANGDHRCMGMGERLFFVPYDLNFQRCIRLPKRGKTPRQGDHGDGVVEISRW
jgi:hypothetical protein